MTFNTTLDFAVSTPNQADLYLKNHLYLFIISMFDQIIIRYIAIHVKPLLTKIPFVAIPNSIKKIEPKEYNLYSPEIRTTVTKVFVRAEPCRYA